MGNIKKHSDVVATMDEFRTKYEAGVYVAPWVVYVGNDNDGYTILYSNEEDRTLAEAEPSFIELISQRIANLESEKVFCYAAEYEALVENGTGWVTDTDGTCSEVTYDPKKLYFVYGDEGTIDDGKEYVYTGTVPKSILHTLNMGDVNKFDKIPSDTIETVNTTFVIPATNVDYNNMPDDEFFAFCDENQYAFVIVMPMAMYKANKYTITNYGGDDVKAKFEAEGTMVIKNQEYVILSEYGKEDIMAYVPLYNEDIAFIYKLTLNNF